MHRRTEPDSQRALSPITPDPSTSPQRARLRRVTDGLVGSDPGLTRLFSALEVMAAVLATVGVAFVFMRLTHVLWLEAPDHATAAQLAGVDAQHRGMTLLAVILGGLLGLMSAFLVLETEPRAQALTLVLMPLPLLLTMALSIKLEPHRVTGIAVMAIVIALGVYARQFVPRFGPRALLYGNLLFVGYFFGFLSGGSLEEHQLGWLAVIMFISAAVAFVLKQFWNRVRAGRLARLRHDLIAQSRSVAAAALDVWTATTPRAGRRARRRLHKQIARWSAAALTIDALLGERPDTDGRGAAVHQALFDFELAVQNVARFAELLSEATLSPEVRAEVGGWLADLATMPSPPSPPGPPPPMPSTQGMWPRAAAWLAHLNEAVAEQRQAVETWGQEAAASDARDGTFESAVTLIYGNLPGSALAGVAAATPRVEGGGWTLSPAARTALRVAIAVGAASIVGSLVSEHRFYWAVIAVFIAFMGAETSVEQVRKAFHRVIGSVVGILLGSVIAHAIGTSAWAVLAIALSLGIGVYYMSVNYAIMVVGITVMVSMLYEQLGELTDSLLVLRVTETLIGSALAMIAALTIFPVDTRRAALIAAERVLGSLADLLTYVRRALAGDEEAAAALTSASRALDHEATQLAATARPLAYDPRRREPIWDEMRLFGEAAHHARNLVAQVPLIVASGTSVGDDVLTILQREGEVVRGTRAALEAGDAPAPSTDLAAPIAAIHQRLIDEGHAIEDPQRRFARHLRRLDDAVAQISVRLRDRREDARPVPPGADESPAGTTPALSAGGR